MIDNIFSKHPRLYEIFLEELKKTSTVPNTLSLEWAIYILQYILEEKIIECSFKIKIKRQGDYIIYCLLNNIDITILESPVAENFLIYSLKFIQNNYKEKDNYIDWKSVCQSDVIIKTYSFNSLFRYYKGNLPSIIDIEILNDFLKTFSLFVHKENVLYYISDMETSEVLKKTESISLCIKYSMIYVNRLIKKELVKRKLDLIV